MPGAGKCYKVKANEFLFSFNEAAIANLDFIQKSPTVFNVIKDHRSVNTRLVDIDATGKKITVEVDGETYNVEIRDELDQMLDVMGFGVSTAKLIKEVKAPMPGMVLEVVVTEGQQIKEGEKILILGAMKMENSIVIHGQARIRKVMVNAGQAVEKGQVLVELE